MHETGNVRPDKDQKQQDVSHQALGLARLVDRVCRRPGRYIIILDIPDPRRQKWQVELLQADALRHVKLQRR